MMKPKESVIPVVLWVATVIFAALFASGGERHKVAARHAPVQAMIGSSN